MDSGFFVSGTWISDSNREWIHSGFLELYSGFHSPGFRIPQQQTMAVSRRLTENIFQIGRRLLLRLRF